MIKYDINKADICTQSMKDYFSTQKVLADVKCPSSIEYRSINHIYYLFYSCLLDYGMKSSIYHDNLIKTYNEYPDIFNPIYVCNNFSANPDKLFDIIKSNIHPRYPNIALKKWLSLSSYLARENDLREKLKAIDSYDKLYTFITNIKGYGQKTGGLLIRLIIEQGICNVTLDNIPIDRHDIEISYLTKVINKEKLSNSEILALGKIWVKSAQKYCVSATDIDKYLWSIGSKLCVKKKCPICPLKDICKTKVERSEKMTKEEVVKLYEEITRENKDLSLDETLYAIYKRLRNNDDEAYDYYRKTILELLGIDELEYYTKDVDKDLKEYIRINVFPEYAVNDQAHGIVHIMEVIRRCFALNATFKLNLDINMIYAMAACHDLGKHENHEIHEKIAGARFYSDDNMKKFFTDEERLTIKEAIEDHRSSKEDTPRSVYGKLISSADRNTTIDMVFIRSFFVAQERMPEENIEAYLDYTIKRLSKRYSEENPENMFYEDQTYQEFLKDMRAILKNEEEFKERYCKVNHITNRNGRVCDAPGNIEYTKQLIKI